MPLTVDSPVLLVVRQEFSACMKAWFDGSHFILVNDSRNLIDPIEVTHFLQGYMGARYISTWRDTPSAAAAWVCTHLKGYMGAVHIHYSLLLWSL